MRGTTTTNFWTMSTVFLLSSFVHAFGSHSCPGLECWYLNEKVARGGLTAPPSQEKSLLHISAEGHHAPSLEDLADPSFLRVYSVADPAATLCHRSRKGAARKPHCELSRFQPQFSTLTWAASLADGLSPLYLQADWFSAAVQDLEGRHGTSSIMRAATGTNELDVVLTVTSSTLVVQSRLGEPVLLDCQFWTNTASPLCGSGFAVEWRYQYRGDGRLLLAYDGKSDRVSQSPEEGTMLDFEGLHRKGNASLVLQEAQVHHSGMYICMVYLPHLLAQVTIQLEIAEPPSLSIHPSSLPVTAPGQILTVHCEASGFAPHSLELNWQWKGPDGKTRSLGPGRLTGHRQAWDGTYSQDTRLELDTSDPELGGGGELTCVAEHSGGTRRASVALRVIGFSTPSIEDSMAMVGVALVLYGFIKFVSWTFLPSGSTDAEETDKKEK
ncbi:tapasin isoform X2 [Hippocampus comes]|uniref:TAP binding protein (tapasin), tandem duplicate 2 n=1 Tax=Hippocampus comes TaxID=109280 RepID=A0A3Q2XLI9_HIPCM|nr:PREDICTED: tapasin isoform X1 [Hippocampus comes]XP_019744514.1 PREDICTED: tapasin isoform X2 [Hippocampus comes]